MAIVGVGGSEFELGREKGLTLHALKTGPEGGVDCAQGLADRKVSQACRGALSPYDWAA